MQRARAVVVAFGQTSHRTVSLDAAAFMAHIHTETGPWVQEDRELFRLADAEARRRATEEMDLFEDVTQGLDWNAAVREANECFASEMIVLTSKGWLAQSGMDEEHRGGTTAFLMCVHNLERWERWEHAFRVAFPHLLTRLDLHGKNLLTVMHRGVPARRNGITAFGSKIAATVSLFHLRTFQAH